VTILIITIIVLWAYVGVVLSLVAAELTIRGRGEQRDTFNMILVRAAVMLVLAPLLAFPARIDWYEESEG
jgi:lysylphosphatidylglycerol synthetase-like protein (DUF2156 family)